jgi:phosphoglycerol transferase MdoB-like AlkP superfamily enzyme
MGVQCKSLKILNVCEAIAFVQLLVPLLIGLYAWLVERSQSGFYVALTASLAIAWIIQGMSSPSQAIYGCFIFTYLIGVLTLLLVMHVMHFMDVATLRMLFLALLIISIPLVYVLYRRAKKVLSELEPCL